MNDLAVVALLLNGLAIVILAVLVLRVTRLVKGPTKVTVSRPSLVKRILKAIKDEPVDGDGEGPALDRERLEEEMDRIQVRLELERPKLTTRQRQAAAREIVDKGVQVLGRLARRGGSV